MGPAGIAPYHLPLCEAKGISKDFTLPHGQVLHVLDRVDLSVHPDEVVALIGPSGCGKSTFLRILAGLVPPTAGEVLYHGRIQRGFLPGVSIVFQNFALYPWMTVSGNIRMVLKAEGLPVDEMERRTGEAIALIGLSGFEEAYPREISGGMKQRVGMARALARDPEILFMDEPFSAVDAFTAEGLREEVLKIWSAKRGGLRSILLVSHDIKEVAYMADRIVVLETHPGRVREVIENRIPRPRDYRSGEFLDLVDRLHDTYGRGDSTALVSPPIEEALGPLPSAGVLEIIGLLQYLNGRGGTEDIFRIGVESRQHFEKVVLVVQAAELLNFVEIPHRTVALTVTGRKFLAAPEGDRRDLWHEQLLTLPIFRKVAGWLEHSPSRSLDRGQLMDLLVLELPNQDVHMLLNTLTRWGHYGGLFEYHKRSKSLSLPSPNRDRR